MHLRKLNIVCKMASVFGGETVEELLNGEAREDYELPSDDENIGGEDLFANGNGETNAGGGDANAVHVEPKKRSVCKPRLKLTVDTLSGPRGIHTIEEYFKGIKFKGKGREKEDLDEVIRRLQHWAHRMFPNYKFDDVLTNVERLGKKKSLHVHMSRYRLGMLDNLNNNGEVHEDEQEGSGDIIAADEPFDEFDALLGEQIAISKSAPRTPAHSSFDGDGSNATLTSSTFTTPSFTRGNAVMSTPYSNVNSHKQDHLNDSDLAQPLPPSQPTSPTPPLKLTSEQLARIEENRRIALQRLKARKERLLEKQTQSSKAESPIPDLET